MDSGAQTSGRSGGQPGRWRDKQEGNLMPVIESSVTAVVRERASLPPNDVAFTFIDREQDWDSLALSLTWSQLYRRARNGPSAKTLRFAWRPGCDIGTAGARLHSCGCRCAGGFAGLRDDRREPSRNSGSTLRSLTVPTGGPSVQHLSMRG